MMTEPEAVPQKSTPPGDDPADAPAAAPATPLWWRLTRSTLFIVACVSIFLLIYQPHMMYMPQPYEHDDFIGFPEEGVELEFTTSQGRQVVFYVPPLDPVDDSPIWMLFNGNADKAMSWRWFVRDHPQTEAGFLLFDYPGYGYSAGRPSPAAALEASHGAVEALAAHLGIERAELAKRMNMMGHSLGAAAAAQFAAAQPPRRLVMVSPFTSMLDMARGMVGWPLCHLLRHRWDNRARLAELAALENPPVVVLIHGVGDDLIPLSMSQELAKAHPEMVELVPVDAGDHNNLFTYGQNEIHRAMKE